MKKKYQHQFELTFHTCDYLDQHIRKILRNPILNQFNMLMYKKIKPIKKKRKFSTATLMFLSFKVIGPQLINQMHTTFCTLYFFFIIWIYKHFLHRHTTRMKKT